MATWQFVADMATSTPTVLLDLNDRNPLGIGSFNVDPPDYDIGRAGGPLRHGQRIVRSTANNRTIELEIHMFAAGPNATATAIENLGRQLAVNNILKIQFGSTPVFVRTFANPQYAATIRALLNQATTVTLHIEAEPFAYGPRVEVTGSPFTVANDPAAGTNPCRFDITGVLGDQPSPLLLVATSTGASGAPSGFVSKRVHVATRRRGSPSGYSNVVQAENMTQSNGAVATVDAAFSNGNKSRITPVTNGANLLRLADTFPENGTSTIEARGEYRVYAKVAKTVAADPVTVQLGYGASSATAVFNDAVTLPTANTGPWLVDLGLVPVPPWADPVTIGPSGVQTKVVLPFVGLWVNRASGTTVLDVDYLYFMPADEPTTVIAQFPATDNVYAIDGTTDAGGAVYSVTAALDEIITTATSPQIVGGGGFPELTPGVTNRIHLLRQVDQGGTVDALTNTTTIRAYYWPRWREFTRP